MLNSTEIRPTEMVRVQRTLKNLTLMAIDHPDAMDAVLSRWLQSCSSSETVMAVADKMNWDTGAGPMFREAMESIVHHQEEASMEAPPVEIAEPEPPEDDGFQAVELTRPRD